jgi:hypothetical protein
MSEDAGSSDLPLLTVDMDGVICRPILGWNAGIHRELLDPATPPKPARVYPRWLNAPLDHLRFDLRRPMPGAREAMQELATIRRLVLLTGRRTAPHGWLGRHGFEGIFERVVINDTRARSPHYKLNLVRALGAHEHVDDDPRTAQLLAESSQARIFLCDWPRNRDLSLDPRIIRVPDAIGLARLLLEESHLDPERSAQ